MRLLKGFCDTEYSMSVFRCCAGFIRYYHELDSLELDLEFVMVPI